ncbi:MAG: hypothetical protein KCHDKBKB_01747 [Elusimicrobia bacterium]|nr:hypothetical protein [Elusimicrobiota bacterium]
MAISILGGIFFMGGALGYFRNRENRQNEALRMTTVLRARKFIPSGKPLLMDWIEEVEIPAPFETKGVLKNKNELLDAKGVPKFMALVGIPKGEFVTRHVISDSQEFIGVSWSLEPGQVAMSLRLPLEQAVAGLLQPGDVVDVVGFSKGYSRRVLSQIRVLAVGDRIWEATSGGSTTPFSSPLAADTILVTLMIGSDEAIVMHQNMHTGLLSLILRSPLYEHNYAK